MKVIVDELPKCCEECPCCNKDVDYGSWCNLGAYRYDEWHQVNTKHCKCPLQSLTDYTKQVRKEVCEEIINKLDNISGEHTFKIKGGIGVFTCVPRQTLEEILNQIQGETK